MRPRTLSATSVESYLQCPMRFAASLQGKRLNEKSGPSTFGSAMHACLDKYIEKVYDSEGFLIPEMHDEHDMQLLLDLWQAAANVFLDFGDDYVDEGHAMLIDWMRTRSLPRKVLSRESKEFFEIEVPGFEGQTQRITYICDRVDEMPDGGIEVIDYKTQYERVNHETMRRLIQPNLYALAMRKRYPGVEKVDVTYDLLRYDAVTVTFTGKQMDSFERYLMATAERVWKDDDPMERINKGCKWCPRKAVCATLQSAVNLGYSAVLPPEQLAELRNTALYAKKAFEVLLNEVDEVLLEQMRHEDTIMLDLDDKVVRATTKPTESYDPEVVVRVLGHDAYPFMKVGKTALEKEFKRRESRFTPEQVADVRAMSRVTHGDPQVEVTQKGQPSA